MKFLSIDKIEEGDYADCEDDCGVRHIIDFYEIPSDAREGTILIAGTDGKWIIDEELTKKRREDILKLRKEIYKST